MATGALADALRKARQEGFATPATTSYAEGALVAAAVAPGIAPAAGARVGVGSGFEGGIGYTGRGARIDLRHAFASGGFAFSAGVGVSVPFYGRSMESLLPGVDVGQLHGYGADVPLLVGWASQAGLYTFWAGARGGYEHVVIERLSSEPKDSGLSPSPVGLTADRGWGGALVGFAVGVRRLHVAFEVEADYQTLRGNYAGRAARLEGVSLTPSSALWWRF